VGKTTRRHFCHAIHTQLICLKEKLWGHQFQYAEKVGIATKEAVCDLPVNFSAMYPPAVPTLTDLCTDQQ
jgi:hypothetical protein